MRPLRHLLATLLLTGCAQTAPKPTAASSPEGWAAGHWQRLMALLAEPAAGRRVAVFDWDNTIMRNDIGDATVFWMLRHDHILAPPDGDWRRISPGLSDAAADALQRACPGNPLLTSKHAACADEILSIYDNGRTTTAADAWRTPDTPTLHQTYLFGAQLLTGHDVETARGFARAAYQEASAAPVGTQWTVGTQQVTGWVRLYPQMRALMQAARERGVEVWVVSASSQHLVEAVASNADVPPENVVGIRLESDAAGHLTPASQPCGGDPGVITFDEGKRCWINKVIFGLPDPQQKVSAPPDQRPVLAAGDADTDLAMLQDATGLKLVINRQKTRLMCHAFGNGDGKWLVQPMFIDPLPQRTQPYPCSTTVDGWGKPLVDSMGRALADQAE